MDHDDSIPKLLLKSATGFCTGLFLTYMSFMFFVRQLCISIAYASFISSIFGLVLTLGLAFNYRIRCLVLLLIPQLFSRVGRYSLTCYALVLLLTGPATNTLRNSEVLSESMACSQEEISSNIRQIVETEKNPLNILKGSIKLLKVSINEASHRMRGVISKIGDLVIRIETEKNPLNILKGSIKLLKVSINEASHRMRGVISKIGDLVIRIGDEIQSSFSWLNSIVTACNQKFGVPYNHCISAVENASRFYGEIKSIKYIKSTANLTCECLENQEGFFSVAEYASVSFAATIKRKLKTFKSLIDRTFFANIKVHHEFTVSGNVVESGGLMAAGTVTEMRNRANPMLTWLSWTSYVTSMFLLLIIFRAKYYEHMYITRSRFDNRYITQHFHEIDKKRHEEGRDTVLPLHRREETKYIMATSLSLMATERIYLTRAVVHMTITTFKLLIHVVADYSLYWVLMTIHHHGSAQPAVILPKDAGVHVLGEGPIAEILRTLFYSFTTPLRMQSLPARCLPNPYSPDYRQYAQIAILIALLWFCALFEPYGLRLRHIIMDHYRPARAKARAMWLYNHILRTRGSFMKLARRKLHREYKYTIENKQTFRSWLNSFLPCWFYKYMLGISPNKKCLLCSVTEEENNTDTKLVRCDFPHCPGVYCLNCFSDLGELCTICLSPADYGDMSDVSLEWGSSDSDQDSAED